MPWKLSALASLLVLVFAVAAHADNSGKGSVIIAEGFADPNDYPTELLPQIFHDWCNDVCVPTVRLEVVDSEKTRPVGFIYAWGQDFEASQDGSTLRFREFILYDLGKGQIFTISKDGGHPGGAFVDTTLIPPKVPGLAVLAGGAEGDVVGGTGRYKKAGGGYSTRLKVEFAGPDPTYYDELYIRFREVRVK